MIIIDFSKQLNYKNKNFRYFYKKFIYIIKLNIIFIIINLYLNIRLYKIRRFSRIFENF